MEREETRAAAAPSPLLSPSERPHWCLKLPFLTARPGNVGVQIDSFRTLTLFNRPRCGEFTSQFRGFTYEDGSMENYARIVERTNRRARIVAERLEKLRHHEQQMQQAQDERRRRREQREVAKERKRWLQLQAIKCEEERRLEHEATTVIQRHLRGWLARQTYQRRKQDRQIDQSARVIQRGMTSILQKKKRMEQEKEMRMRAAQVLQRQTRKHLKGKRRATIRPPSPPLPPPPSTDNTTEDTVTITIDALSEDSGVSLSSLFSDVKTKEHTLQSAATEDEVESSIETHETPVMTDPAPSKSPKLTDQLVQPKRPVSIKRVGGGFRHSPLKSNMKPQPPAKPERSLYLMTPRKPGYRSPAASAVASPTFRSSIENVIPKTPELPSRALPSPASHRSHVAVSSQQRLWQRDDEDDEAALIDLVESIDR